MDDSDGRVGFIDVLSSGTTRTTSNNFKVFFTDLDIDVFCLWKDSNRRRRSVDATIFLSRRDALDTVDS